LNKNITLAIFDSHQNFGEGVGLQIEAVAEKLSFKDSLSAIKLYFERKWPYGKVSPNGIFEELVKNKVYYFYKATPTKIWMNDPREETDVRVEIKLS